MAQDDVHLAKAIRHLCDALEALLPDNADIAEARKHTRTVLNRGKAQDDEGYITDQPGTGAHE